MNVLKIQPCACGLQILKYMSNYYCRTITKKGIIDELQVKDIPSYSIETKYNQYELHRIRNKSGLNSNHANILNNRKPYNKSMVWYHNTVWYRKKMLGKYGIKAASITAAIAWPTQEQVEDLKVYEQTLYSISMQNSLEKIQETKKIEAIKIKQREEHIVNIMTKFNKWKSDLKCNLQKKLFDSYKIRAKKRRVVNNIREKYGYSMGARDVRAKEYENQSEAEKKKTKQAKKTDKIERDIAFIKKQEGILK